MILRAVEEFALMLIAKVHKYGNENTVTYNET